MITKKKFDMKGGYPASGIGKRFRDKLDKSSPKKNTLHGKLVPVKKR